MLTSLSLTTSTGFGFLTRRPELPGPRAALLVYEKSFVAFAVFAAAVSSSVACPRNVDGEAFRSSPRESEPAEWGAGAAALSEALKSNATLTTLV
jgi:hypothetical protein